MCRFYSHDKRFAGAKFISFARERGEILSDEREFFIKINPDIKAICCLIGTREKRNGIHQEKLRVIELEAFPGYMELNRPLQLS